ncbi:HAD family hydrolase [Candidatus Micrarchaeota archaeon]|nr:HAD family hydrolase [Candidatus Micrarchaeota archaeon]
MALIVFDWDGVLYRGVKVKLRAFGQACREKASLPSRYAVERYWEGGRNNFEVFEREYREYFGRQPPENLAKQMQARYSELLKGRIEKAGLFKEVKTALAGLAEDGHTLAISSSANPESIASLLAANGIRYHFNEVLGTTTKKRAFTKGKPHLSHLQQKFGVPASKIVFVGDAPEDMRVGKEFGAITVGRRGTCSEEKLRAAGARHTVSNLHELRRLVRRLE